MLAGVPVVRLRELAANKEDEQTTKRCMCCRREGCEETKKDAAGRCALDARLRGLPELVSRRAAQPCGGFPCPAPGVGSASASAAGSPPRCSPFPAWPPAAAPAQPAAISQCCPPSPASPSSPSSASGRSGTFPAGAPRSGLAFACLGGDGGGDGGGGVTCRGQQGCSAQPTMA